MPGNKVSSSSFRIILYRLGRPFTIPTNHRVLEWLDKLKENNSRLTRWSLSLQPFNYRVENKCDKLNGNADSLSRYIHPDTT